MQAPCTYNLRPAKNSDGRAIWALISSVLVEYGIVADLATTDQDLVDVETNYEKTGGAFLLLMDGERLIGTVALSRKSDSICELCRMYIAAGYRGKGLGRMLMETALRRATECCFSEIRLSTAAVLKEALGLYRSAGFAPVDGPLTCKNCNLVMSKRLR